MQPLSVSGRGSSGGDLPSWEVRQRRTRIRGRNRSEVVTQPEADWRGQQRSGRRSGDVRLIEERPQRVRTSLAPQRFQSRRVGPRPHSGP